MSGAALDHLLINTRYDIAAAPAQLVKRTADRVVVALPQFKSLLEFLA